MDFFIRKGSTLPIIKLQLIRDGRIDYNKFADMLETSIVTFSMVNRDTGIYKIANKPATIMLREVIGQEDPEYYLTYKLSHRDTKDEGVYYGEFRIQHEDMCDESDKSGVLKMPIREELYIYILDSFTRSENLKQ